MTRCLSLVLLLLLCALPARADTVTLKDINSDLKGYDGKAVTVTAEVKNYFEKPGYCGFLLFDSGKAVSGYSEGHLGLENGTRVTVTGTFKLRLDAQGRVFSNVIVVEQSAPAP